MFRWNSFGPLATSIEDGGPIQSLVPPSEFSFQWTASTHATLVNFTLEKRGGGTIVNVSEEGFTNCFEDLLSYAQCATGWGEAMTLLKYFLEHRLLLRLRSRLTQPCYSSVRDFTDAPCLPRPLPLLGPPSRRHKMMPEKLVSQQPLHKMM